MELKALQEKLASAPQRREITLDVKAAKIDKEARTVEIALSSEAPYLRWFGYEILGHGPGEIIMDRLLNKAPWLEQHDPNKQRAVIEGARVDSDRVLRVTPRFSKSEKAEELFQDIIDEIRVKASVGYIVHEMVLVKEEKDQPPVYRVTKWEPYEGSTVSVPADDSVGVGRAADPPKTQPVEQEKAMPTEPQEKSAPVAAAPPAPVVDVKAAQAEALGVERERVAEIRSIREQFQNVKEIKEFAEGAISNGMDAGKVRAFALEQLAKASKEDEIRADIGMTPKEAQGYSLKRAIHAAASGDWSKAGLEQEASKACEDLGFQARNGGFLVPQDALAARQDAKRDLVVNTGSAGGYLVETQLASGSFIELLRNQMSIMQLGARQLTGLVGDVQIPKQTGAATAYWLDEGNAPTESQQTLGQLLMTPKTVGAYTDISRKMLKQSSIDAEMFVRQDLTQVLALAIDLAGIQGTGAAGQPLGIVNWSGIGSQTFATASDPTWTETLGLMADVETANALMGNLAYLTTPAVKANMMAKQKGTGDGFVWTDANTVAGYRALASNQMVAAKVLFGNYGDVILGMWGALEILVDPYTGSSSGTVRVTSFQDVDWLLRHVGSFSLGSA